MTAAHRRAAGGQIIRLNPFNTLNLGSDGVNPIAALELDDDLPDNALELAEAIIRIEGHEPHWSQSAQELIAAIIMYVRLVIPNGSFADVRQLIGRDDAGIRNLVRGGRDLDPRQLELFERNPDDYLENNPDYRAPVKHNGRLYPGMIEAAEIYDCPEIETKAARFGGINAAIGKCTRKNRCSLMTIVTPDSALPAGRLAGWGGAGNRLGSPARSFKPSRKAMAACRHISSMGS
jgi:hypothetical protein